MSRAAGRLTIWLDGLPVKYLGQDPVSEFPVLDSNNNKILTLFRCLATLCATKRICCRPYTSTGADITGSQTELQMPHCLMRSGTHKTVRVNTATETTEDNNKKFWEELIAYFPWYDTGYIENDASNNSSIVACVFVTAVTFLPSRCLATTGRMHRHTHTHRQQ
jgi:hypothetical protein